jgi:quinolinate synthase
MAFSAASKSGRRLMFRKLRSSSSSSSSSATTVQAQAQSRQRSASSFPSLILGANKSITPIGSFAEAQAEFLHPDQASVMELKELMRRANAGIVAHYYMDVELQGILHAATSGGNGSSSSSIAIADSLAMGDAALRMAQSGRTSIACLGVDFMSESVQAILDYNYRPDDNNSSSSISSNNNKQQQIPVYRLSERKIGCSLAESAERDDYTTWLQQAAAKGKPALHVVYINTSLETKARSNAILPTITCTSSNVLQTILTASSQIPNLDIYYGPDTYMGENLLTMLRTISTNWSDEDIRTKLHAHHTKESLRQLHEQHLHVYPNGNCIVHHMFGADVVQTVHAEYDDAYITAHLEVPGEMFQLAMDASLDKNQRGVVGSTSNILNFIIDKVQNSSARDDEQSHLKFILGTEAGMVTSIVQKLQPLITGDRTVEIIFPVASDAVTIGDGNNSINSSGHHDDDGDDQKTLLPLIPGVKATEGCSTAGGCATCPFMKMNDFDALMKVLQLMGDDNNDSSGSSSSTKLQKYRPLNRLAGVMIQNRPAMEWAIEPIQYMRTLGQHQRLPDELMERLLLVEDRHNNTR